MHDKPMERKELEKLTDEELIQKAKKVKSGSFINALLVGFMIGIIIWSVAKNTIAWLLLSRCSSFTKWSIGLMTRRD